MATNLLLLEESLLVQRVVELAFRDGDFEVHIAQSADEALATAHDASPDVVLVGLDMENADGLDFCRSLRQAPGCGGAALIVLTSTRGEIGEAEITELSVAGSIEKPFKPLTLTTEVDRVLAAAADAGRQEHPPEDAPAEETAAGEAVAGNVQDRPSESAEEFFTLEDEETEAVIHQSVERTVERILPALSHRVEAIVVERLPDLVEKIVLREIEKIKHGE